MALPPENRHVNDESFRYIFVTVCQVDKTGSTLPDFIRCRQALPYPLPPLPPGASARGMIVMA
jgi:hypothetical protein